MRRSLLALMILSLPFAGGVLAEGLQPPDGWRVIDSAKSYATLIDAVKAATKANTLNVVAEAGPTDAARALGVTLPGNRVIEVFHARFAVRVLPLSTAAMIEAPIRFYVTEDADGTATLAWKTPSFVFAPYVGEAGPELSAIASELDTLFEAIAAQAVAE